MLSSGWPGSRYLYTCELSEYLNKGAGGLQVFAYTNVSCRLWAKDLLLWVVIGGPNFGPKQPEYRINHSLA
jgi:hypothetical protein